MTINNDLFTEFFETLPGWICSKCQKGTLTLLDNAKIQFTPRIWIDAQHDPNFYDELTEQIFGFALQCQNADCGHGSLVSGTVTSGVDHDKNGQPYWRQYFCPRNFVQPPLIFPMSDAVPESVQIETLKAFALFWSDESAAANKIRNVVEAILTNKKIAKTEISKKKKKVKLTTHKRIEKFSVKCPDEGNLLMGLKWKGNESSHFTDEKASKPDLLEIFELLHHVLQEIYDRRSLKIHRRAEEFTKNKGRPASQKVIRARLKKK